MYSNSLVELINIENFRLVIDFCHISHFMTRHPNEFQDIHFSHSDIPGIRVDFPHLNL